MDSSPFRISSFCHAGGCVAVALAPDRTLVRSSTVTDGPVLAFPADQWSAFTAAVSARPLSPSRSAR